ncbi:MAG: VWA domain-containing protein [Alistipes sp.]|nr:VWA domain-containing protein [Alistipes sp.]
MNFQNPEIFWLLLLVPLLVAYHIWIGRRRATLTVSTLGRQSAPRTLRYWLRPLPVILRLAAIMMFVVALARPVKMHAERDVTVEGVDIVLAMDISGSMLAQDFKPDRLEASKRIASEFVADREGDRLSVVAFAGEAFTQAPLTPDRAAVQTALARLRSGIIDDGTAIGNGLATAINRMRESGAKSKVVVLMTDGVNNSGQISPRMAAEIARDLGIKVYTIGVGRRGKAPTPAMDPFGNVFMAMMDVEIDEDLLREISKITGGKYFRAENVEALTRIYEEIDQMEKSKIEVTDYVSYEELFFRWVLWGVLLLMAELFISRVVLNRLT